jgi:RimJ/RimL family protein N-acetyltransferase
VSIENLLPKNFDQFVIRKWSDEDALQLADIEFDPEVKQYLSLPEISKVDYLKDFLPCGWAIAANPGHIVAGTIDMSVFELNPKKRELRIFLSKEFRNRGFAFEAARFLISNYFDLTWFEGIVAVIHPDNSASIALCKKLGFTHTGEHSTERQVFELSRSQFLSQQVRV